MNALPAPIVPPSSPTLLAGLLTLFGVALAVALWAAAPPAPDGRAVDAVLAIPVGEVQRLDAAIAAIPDPVVRQAALMEWLRQNQDRVDLRSMATLCEHLDATNRALCLRRLGSPHLQGHAFP